MRRIFAGVIFCAAAAFVAAPSIVTAKSAKECEAEWKDNKDALQGAKIKKKDFIPDCRADKEVIPGKQTQAAPAAPAPAPPQPTAPRPAPAPQRTIVQPTTPGTPTKANEFENEAATKAKCPSDTLVWVNTKSGIYHFAGAHNYGTTKEGAYMCETDTSAAGYRAAKNEKHP